MSLKLDPASALSFQRPFTEHVKRTLTITNNNNLPVAFKVKTTAPKLYCVRPNIGRLEPGETEEVLVMLQAMEEDPPLNIKCKDKFLIQSTLITPEREAVPLQDIWNTEGGDLYSHKLKVVYLRPEGEEEEQHPNMSSSIEVPDSYFNTVRQIPQHPEEHEAEPEPAPLPIPAPHSAPPPPQPREEPQEPPEVAPEPPAIVNVSVHAQQPPSPPPSPPPPPPPAPVIIPDPNPELLAKLQEAQAEIVRLRHLISSMPEPSNAPTPTIETSISPTDFRSRRTSTRGGARSTTVVSDDYDDYDSSTDVATSYVSDDYDRRSSSRSKEGGVPLQAVIVVALGVFILTYLFF
ncbi:VAMP-associated protein (VAP) family protein [Abortiporus biennis]